MKLPLIIAFLLFSYSCKKSENSSILAENKTSCTRKQTTFEEKLSDAALSIIDEDVVYTPSYVAIKYPNGDVPAKTGVCTDVIIRTYRKIHIDLQKEVHEDLKANFSKYPNLKKWGLKTPDTNIDHRRVPNLEVFFERKGKKLPVTGDADDYKTGEIVTWMIGGKLPHVGIVVQKKSADGLRPMIVHNVGGGQVLEDCLFRYPIVGHYLFKK